MKTKIIQFIPALITLVFIGFRYFSNWCINSVPSCYGSLIHQSYQYFTYPLFLFSLFLFPVTLILIFVPRHLFISWLKFAVWAIPLSFIYIATTPVSPPSQGFGMFSGGPDRTEISINNGLIFLVLSLIVVILAFIRERLVTAGKRSREEIDSIVKELWMLAGAIAGFIFAILFLYASIAPLSVTIDAASSYFFGMLVFGISVLGYASLLTYRKICTHSRPEWRLILTFVLSGMTIIIFALSIVASV